MLDDVESGVLQEGQAFSLAGDDVVVEFDEEERLFVLGRLGHELAWGSRTWEPPQNRNGASSPARLAKTTKVWVSRA